MIRLEGVREFKSALRDTISAEQEATRRATSIAAHLIERVTKEKLSVSGRGERGRDAKGKFTKAIGSPSAPGEPPHLQTGNLRRSITVVGPDPTTVGGYPGWKAQIGPTAIYGRIQELGGFAGHVILPARPYLGPAYDEVHPKLRGIFMAEWRKPLML